MPTTYLWAYIVDTKKLARILSVRAGAEATGLQAVDNLNGFNYTMSSFQHPSDEMILPAELKAQVEPLINKYWDNKLSGSVGYLSGIPTMQQLVEWKGSDKSLSVLREIAGKKGAKVTWHNEDRSVSIELGSNKMSVKLGEAKAVINGKTVDLPFAARLEKEKTMFPSAVLDQFLNS